MVGVIKCFGKSTFFKTHDWVIKCFGKSTFFKTHDWVIKLDTNSKNRPKASLHKGGGLRPPPTKGAGRSAARPPLWESFMEAGFRPEFDILLTCI